MEFSDMKQNVCATKNEDTVIYENTTLATRRSAPPDKEKITEEEEHYEQLRASTYQNENKYVQAENARINIKWKDIPNRMKYSVYIFSSMLIVLYIGVIIVTVFIALPKTQVDGIWTHWSAWSDCDVTCANGTQKRMRLCTNPSLSSVGLDCPGGSADTKHCQLEPCPVNGDWSLWSPWGTCSVSCDVGIERRDRTCSSPYPNLNGNHCFGESRDYRICMPGACSDGSWSVWGSWGSCSDSCGGGVRSRLRTCANPKPSLLGRYCDGSSEQVISCNKQTCSDHKVAFTAYGSSNGTSSSVVTFPHTWLNIGGGYSTSTGRFTCTIPGIYNFAVTLTKIRKDIDQIIAYLTVSGVNKLELRTDPDDHDNIDYGSYSLSVTGNFHLNKNDYASVYGADYSYFYNDFKTSFSGILVIPDDEV